MKIKNYHYNRSNKLRDNIGNHKSSKELKIQPDNIGNCLNVNFEPSLIPDNIGNSIELAPTHNFNREYFKKGDQQNIQRVGKYLVGGVNPAVTPELINFTNQHRYNSEPLSGSNKKMNQIQSEKRLKKLFEFDDDERVEYVLTSAPEIKQKQIEYILKKIFSINTELKTKITSHIEKINEKLILVVKIKTLLFKDRELSFSALCFLVNKILNRNKLDRIRVSMEIV